MMKDVTDKNFGVIIAFLLPGFLFLWGLSYSFEEVASWFARSSCGEAPTVGGFLFTTLASLAVGLLISAARWLVIDHIHHFTGVRIAEMNFGNLKDKDRFVAFQGAVENHYRYYQYYANTLVAIITSFSASLVYGRTWPSPAMWIILTAIAIALFLGSRDALKKYYERAKAILA